MIIPSALQFTAERLMKSAGRTGTADNDINAIRSMGMIPQGYRVNNYLTDSDAFYIITDVPNGMKMFNRAPLQLQWKVTLILVTLDTKLEKDTLWSF